MENSVIIKENYNKSSGGDFIAKGRCKALFQGEENLEKDIITIKQALGKNLIRVYDIILYNEIEIEDTVIIDDWNLQLNTYHQLPQFKVQFKNHAQAAIYFKKLEWENVDFIRTEIEEGLLINPKIIYAFQEDSYTFGEIEGDLLFRVHNPKPLLPQGIPSSDLPILLNTGCFWSLLRFLILFVLAGLLFKGCSQFSLQEWDKMRDEKIKNDSTLRIPGGDEKEFEDRNKKFIIDNDTTFIVPPGSYKLFIRDHGTKVDHDMVNIFVNGKKLKQNLEIYKKPTEIALTNLKYGENYIDFAVLSQGLSGNCTAKILIINTDDSTFKLSAKINSVVNHVSRIKLIQR
jgi:hypothetical protein